MDTLIAADLDGRRAAALADPTQVPSTRDRNQEFSAQLRAKTVERDGKSFYHLEGYASTVEETYEMYDLWGPYDEVVDRGAFEATLAAEPDVAFLLNHKGMTMARTKAGTLLLSADDQGLRSEAFLNPERTDVRDLVHAINDGDVDQMSFAFRIVRGQWSPDYTEYRILEVDLHRGDVSAVNYGANPFTSIAARAKQAFEAIDSLEGPALRAALARAQARLGETEDAPAAARTSFGAASLRASLAD